MTKTTFQNPDDNEWRAFLEGHPELGTRRQLQPVQHFDTAHGPTPVLTADGTIGLWIKLDPFQVAEWNTMLGLLPEPQPPTPDAEASEWEEYEDQMAWHAAALDQMASKLAQWALPLRHAIVARGWGQHLLINTYEQPYGGEDR